MDASLTGKTRCEMKKQMSPIQVGFAWGVPAGLFMALLALLAGGVSSGLVASGLDLLFAFVFGFEDGG